jgi:hypothetical protein
MGAERAAIQWEVAIANMVAPVGSTSRAPCWHLCWRRVCSTTVRAARTVATSSPLAPYHPRSHVVLCLEMRRGFPRVQREVCMKFIQFSHASKVAAIQSSKRSGYFARIFTREIVSRTV